MSAKASKTPQTPIGEVLRRRRVEVLNKGLREMAKLLDIAPAHLTDLEKGRRKPSEDLLVKIAQQYQIPEADLRSGWERADTVVAEVANQDATTAAKVPEFLRTARGLTEEQWNHLIQQAQKLAGKPGGKAGQ
jgi:transcriptional regulator with XRE-family HTH domain